MFIIPRHIDICQCDYYWPLGRIGGKIFSNEIYASAANYIDWNEEMVLRDQAELILQQALSEEGSEWVIAEIREALDYMRCKPVQFLLHHELIIPAQERLKGHPGSRGR